MSSKYTDFITHEPVDLTVVPLHPGHYEEDRLQVVFEKFKDLAGCEWQHVLLEIISEAMNRGDIDVVLWPESKGTDAVILESEGPCMGDLIMGPVTIISKDVP